MMRRKKLTNLSFLYEMKYLLLFILWNIYKFYILFFDKFSTCSKFYNCRSTGCTLSVVITRRMNENDAKTIHKWSCFFYFFFCWKKTRHQVTRTLGSPDGKWSKDLLKFFLQLYAIFICGMHIAEYTEGI